MVGDSSDALAPFRDVRPGALALSYGLLRQLADIPIRKAWSIAGRFQMEAIRRDPAPLVDKLRGARTVLFVCHGNIIRSVLPLMERFGIATAEEIDIETLADRLRQDVVHGGGVIALLMLVGASTRKL